MNDDGNFLSARNERIFLILAFVIPMTWLIFVRIHGMQDGETANDAYYHMAMAERGPAVFAAKKFPALELSVWRDNFSDKELLYHFMLCGIVKFQKLFVPVLHAPFHFPAFIFIAVLILSFLFAIKRFGVSPPLYLPMTMLALMSAPNVAFRILMLRPHIFSLALMLVMCGQLARGSLRWKTGWALVIALIYTWSYSNPQFIVIPVLFFSLADLPLNGWKSLIPVAGAVLAVFLGLLIHPQFPNSFIIWKVQTIDALFGPLLSEGARLGTLLPPQEMMSPGVIWNRNALPMYVFAYLNFLIFARLIARLGWKNLPPYFYAVGGMSLIFTFGTFLVMRTIEYAGPFNGLFGALVWDMALRKRIFLPGTDRPKKFCLILTLAVFLPTGAAAVRNMSYSEGTTTLPAEVIGAWMEHNLPDRALVINLSWGDFPALFHGNRKQVFLWGMDPEFSVAADPKRTRRIEQLLLNKEELTPRRFIMGTGANYAVVLARRENYIDFLKSLGWRTIYEASDGAVFKVR